MLQHAPQRLFSVGSSLRTKKAESLPILEVQLGWAVLDRHELSSKNIELALLCVLVLAP